MSSLGVFSDECSTFLDMMNDIGIDKKQQRYIIKKMINIAIRATYYIFCCRNRNWDSPDLMQFWIFFFFGFCFVLFLFYLFSFLVIVFFFFLIIQSQAAFVNCLYVERFTIVHSKTHYYYYYYSTCKQNSGTIPWDPRRSGGTTTGIRHGLRGRAWGGEGHIARQDTESRGPGLWKRRIQLAYSYSSQRQGFWWGFDMIGRYPIIHQYAFVGAY